MDLTSFLVIGLGRFWLEDPRESRLGVLCQAANYLSQGSLKGDLVPNHTTTHAQPSLSATPDPNPAPTNLHPGQLHDTAVELRMFVIEGIRIPLNNDLQMLTHACLELALTCLVFKERESSSRVLCL